MTSFYAKTPSGFFVENGWGRIIDPATWEAHETNVGPSFWGTSGSIFAGRARAISADANAFRA